MVGRERLDDDAQLQQYTATHDIEITVIRTLLRKHLPDENTIC